MSYCHKMSIDFDKFISGDFNRRDQREGHSLLIQRKAMTIRAGETFIGSFFVGGLFVSR